MGLQVPSIFRFEQPTNATVWDIAHNLGSGSGGLGTPIVDVFVYDNAALTKIIPSRIDMIDSNNVRITFVTGRSGIATIIV